MTTDRRTDMTKLTVFFFSQFCETRLKLTHFSQIKSLLSPAAYDNEALSQFGYFLKSGLVNNLWGNKNVKVEVSQKQEVS